MNYNDISVSILLSVAQNIYKHYMTLFKTTDGEARKLVISDIQEVIKEEDNVYALLKGHKHLLEELLKSTDLYEDSLSMQRVKNRLKSLVMKGNNFKTYSYYEDVDMNKTFVTFLSRKEKQLAKKADSILSPALKWAMYKTAFTNHSVEDSVLDADFTLHDKVYVIYPFYAGLYSKTAGFEETEKTAFKIAMEEASRLGFRARATIEALALISSLLNQKDVDFEGTNISALEIKTVKLRSLLVHMNDEQIMDVNTFFHDETDSRVDYNEVKNICDAIVSAFKSVKKDRELIVEISAAPRTKQ